MENDQNDDLKPIPPKPVYPNLRTWWDKEFRKEYYKYLTSKWPVLIGLTILIIFIAIPCYHDLTAKIPPTTELIKSSGMIYFQSIKSINTRTQD